MIQAVMWKEWRQQRWKLAFGSVMLLFFTGSLAGAKLTTDKEIYIVVVTFGGMLLALYSAMGVFAPEVAEGTSGFLAARPIRSGTVFLVKWFFGWLNFVVPVVLCGGLLFFIQGREFSTDAGRSYLVFMFSWGIWMATMFYTLTCCLAPRRGGEGTVGITGLIIVAMTFVHMRLSSFTAVDFSPNMRQFITFDRILEGLFLFLNPCPMWFFYMKVSGWVFWFVMFCVEQAILFCVVMLIGMRRWRRSL